ncbi:stalk domain-containing protein [Paenibacillus sp. CAU 1782]
MKKKLLVTLAAGALILTSAAAGAYGATNLQAIKANLNLGLQFKLNGESWIPKDAKGKNVYPITYNGTTYLPIRSAGEALGVEVGWEASNNTVWLGEGARRAEEGKPQVEFQSYRDYEFLIDINGNKYLNSYISSAEIDRDGKLYVPMFSSSLSTYLAIAADFYVITETENPYVEGIIEINRDAISKYISSETIFSSATQSYNEVSYTSPHNGEKFVISTNNKAEKGTFINGSQKYVVLSDVLEILGYKITLNPVDSEKIVLVSFSKL